MAFKKAQREAAKMRLALAGPSGSGKTYSALLVAQGLADGKSIGMIDTEKGSGELYSDLCNYDIAHIRPPYTPSKYIDIIKSADYDVLIIDSASHEWDGTGGVLERHTEAEIAIKNSYYAWKEVTPEHNKFVEAILGYSGHVIITLRSKTAYEVNEKKKPIKIGLAPIQRAGIEYEFTMVLDLEPEKHLATISKNRTSLFDDLGPFVPTIETGKEILGWLISGVDPLLRRKEEALKIMKQYGQDGIIIEAMGIPLEDWDTDNLEEAAGMIKAFIKNNMIEKGE